MRIPFGDTEELEIKVGLHQGSALSPFLYIFVLDTLVGHIGTAIHWKLIFADDIALIGRTKEELQRKILNWQNELKIGGLKISAEKSKILVMERKRETVVKIVDTNGRELGQVEDFKYLGSVMGAEGGSWKAVKQRAKVAWMKWRDMSGVMCDKRMPRKLKCKDSNSTGAVVRRGMLDNEEKGRELYEKNGDANVEMDSRSVIDG